MSKEGLPVPLFLGGSFAERQIEGLLCRVLYLSLHLKSLKISFSNCSRWVRRVNFRIPAVAEGDPALLAFAPEGERGAEHAQRKEFSVFRGIDLCAGNGTALAHQ